MNIELLYYQEIRNFERLSPAEEHVLFERLYAGDSAARECLIHSYLRLVVNIARHPKFTRLAERMDLIQEGNMGLIQAIDNYDPALGIAFVAFARVCIRNRIVSFIQQSGKLLFVLDTPIFEDAEEYITRADMLVDESSVLGDASFGMAEEVLLQEQHHSGLLQALEHLPSREREVLQLLYGIGVQKSMSLQEVSSLLGLTMQRIGQLRDEALAKLPNHLQNYLTP